MALNTSTVEQFVLEQAKVLALELDAAANIAPDGQVLHSLEGLLLTRGREFLQKILTFTAQHQAQQVEKKGHQRGPVPADTPVATRVVPPSRS